jgi:hypothetical protein
MYFPECFAMNAGISAIYFLKPPKSFTDKSSTRYAFIPYLASQHQTEQVRNAIEVSSAIRDLQAAGFTEEKFRNCSLKPQIGEMRPIFERSAANVLLGWSISVTASSTHPYAPAHRR